MGLDGSGSVQIGSDGSYDVIYAWKNIDFIFSIKNLSNSYISYITYDLWLRSGVRKKIMKNEIFRNFFLKIRTQRYTAEFKNDIIFHVRPFGEKLEVKLGCALILTMFHLGYHLIGQWPYDRCILIINELNR